MAIGDFNKKKQLDVESVTGTPTISRTVCLKITSGDDSTTGTGDIVLDWTNIASKSDIGVYDENDNLLNYYFESFDATAKTAVIWVYRAWDRDGTTQLQVAYGDGPSDQSVAASDVFDNETDLKAGYLFNESSGDLLDVTSNNNDGTVYGAARKAPGIVGGAYSFDGSDDFVDTGFAFTGTVSFSLWFYWDLFESSTTRDFIGNRKSNPYYNRAFGISNGEYRLICYDYSAGIKGITTNLSNSVAPSSGQTWIHVVGVIEDNGDGTANFTIYENGAEVASTIDDLYQTDAYSFYIGAYNMEGSANKFFNGDIDNFYIHNALITSDEISAIYDATKSSPTFFSQQAAESTSGTTWNIGGVSGVGNVSGVDNPSEISGVSMS